MAQRWDRDRFERMRGGGGGGPPERDYYRLEEREQMSPRGRHEVMFDERISQKGPHGRYEERERFFEADRHAPARRAPPAFLDDPIPAEVSRQALAPYRKPRPQFIRRQSSLDTFDRRPGPRYGDEYRMPAEVPIPLPIRRRSPRRGEYYEEFEERYRGSDDEYRDVSVRRDHGRSRSRMRSRSVRRRRSRSISSDSSFEEVNKSSIVGRKGRTKLPKRLAHKSAIIELGYPYVEEEKFIIVQRALDKEHIDKIVEMSKKYNAEKVVYKYEGKSDAPPPAPAPAPPAAPKEETKVEVKKEEVKADGTKIEEKVQKTEIKTVTPAPPAPPASAPPAPAAAPAAPPAPPAAPGELVKKTITTTTTIDPPDHHHRHQDLAVAIPRRMTEHDIKREIEMLEAERRLLRYERDGDWELVEHRDRKKDIYRVERDRKGRLALIRSAH